MFAWWQFLPNRIFIALTHTKTHYLICKKRRHLPLFSFVITKKPTYTYNKKPYSYLNGRGYIFYYKKNNSGVCGKKKTQLNMSEICWITITVSTLERRIMYNISLRRGYVTAHFEKSLKNSNSFFKVLKYRLYIYALWKKNCKTSSIFIV